MNDLTNLFTRALRSALAVSIYFVIVAFFYAIITGTLAAIIWTNPLTFILPGKFVIAIIALVGAGTAVSKDRDND